MIRLKRTNASDADFQDLVKELDIDLSIRDGDEHLFYSQFSKIDMIKYVVIAYDENKPVGCGAIKQYDETTVEIKRMYVTSGKRGKGIASMILEELERWSRELGFEQCILETGINQPEASRLYEKKSYHIISNYAQYENIANSICFGKKL
ncbi:MAG: GNAT family N-acetyltransferase [Ginsengibacter sp.]